MSIVLIGAWADQEWHQALVAAMGEPILAADSASAPSATVAVIAGPLTESLAKFQRLELILSLRAGVDALLRPGLVPEHVQIARVKDPSLRHFMIETVLLHVLSAHRRLIDYRVAQRERVWLALPQPRASERGVGILGLGELGAAAASAVASLGFSVTGWSRTPKDVPGVLCLSGDDQLSTVLETSDILVCLLPLTPATTGLLDAPKLAALPRGATVVSLGRGGQLDEAALLDALDGGHLSGAILDVFATEPLPPFHPFWTHDRVIVYPHVAADPQPVTAAATAADLIRRHRSGEVVGTVDRSRGY